MNRLVLAALLLTTGTACNSIAGPAGDARVLTSLGTYTRQNDGAVTIAFSVTNPTRAIVYLGRCRSIDSEVLRRQDSKWTLFRGVEACTANLGALLPSGPVKRCMARDSFATRGNIVFESP